jgi:putative endonuclease
MMAAMTPDPTALPHRTLAQNRGDSGERLVEAALVAAGWQILGRNVHVGRSEIDLIAIDPRPPPALVLVEVRWRRDRDYGLPEESVDWRKRRKLRAAVGGLIEAGKLPDGTPLPTLPMRIDIVGLEPPSAPRGEVRLRHYRSAVGG